MFTFNKPQQMDGTGIVLCSCLLDWEAPVRARRCHWLELGGNVDVRVIQLRMDEFLLSLNCMMLKQIV